MGEFPRFTQGEPIVAFSKGGAVRFSKAAAAELGLSRKGSWIAFLVDKEKLALKVFTTETENALKVSVKTGNPKFDSFALQSKPLITHLMHRLDWAMGEGKKTTIKYTVSLKNTEGIFELI